MQANDCLTPVHGARDHSSLDTTSAESRLRQAAAMVGMNDQDRLHDVLRRMKEEYVVYAWQLSAIDLPQWQALNVPIGMAAAIRQLSLFPKQPSVPSSSSSSVPSPSRSVEQSLLELGSSTHSDQDAIFADEDESVVEGKCLYPLIPPRFTGKISDVLGIPDPPRQADQLVETKSPDLVDEEDDENSGEIGDVDAFNISAVDDSGTMLAPSDSKPLRSSRKREAALAKALEIDSSSGPFSMSPSRNSPYEGSPSSNSVSFQEEWSEVQSILRRLPIADQRALLCQLLIVENGATLTTRAKLAENVILKIRENLVEGTISKDDIDLVVDHLRFFARLRSECRKKFGKVLFSALSELHAPVEKPTRRKEGNISNHNTSSEKKALLDQGGQS
jgi:hypothetical protein